jgi:hypothetical protein
MLPIVFEFNQDYLACSGSMVEQPGLFVYIRTLYQEAWMGTTFFISMN